MATEIIQDAQIELDVVPCERHRSSRRAKRSVEGQPRQRALPRAATARGGQARRKRCSRRPAAVSFGSAYSFPQAEALKAAAASGPAVSAGGAAAGGGAAAAKEEEPEEEEEVEMGMDLFGGDDDY